MKISTILLLLQVTEETVRSDYGYTPPNPRLAKRAGSLPNLPNYVTSIDIQVVPSRTIRFQDKQKKQSEHEKEILKLCGDIITELKPSPVNLNIEVEPEDEYRSYAKINKVSIKHSDSRSPQQQPPQKTEPQKTPEPDKFISVKTVLVEDPCPKPEPKPVEIEIKHNLKRQVSRELPDPVVSNDNVVPLREKSFSDEFSSPRLGGGGFFTSMIERESRENRFEVNDGGFATSEYSSSGADHDSDASSVISDAETVKSYNNNNSSSVEAVKSFSNRSRTASGFDVSKRDLGGGYFENLVNILQEAVKDISR